MRALVGNVALKCQQVNFESVFLIFCPYQLLNILEIQLDEAAKTTLMNFSLVREAIAAEVGIKLDESVALKDSDRLKVTISHAEDVLMAEVSGTIVG